LETKKVLTKVEKAKLVTYKKKFKHIKKKILKTKAIVNKARKQVKKARSKIIKKLKVLKTAKKMTEKGALHITVPKVDIEKSLIIKSSATIQASGSELEAKLLLAPKHSIKIATQVLKKSSQVLETKKTVVAVLHIFIKKIVIEITKITVIIEQLSNKKVLTTQEKKQL